MELGTEDGSRVVDHTLIGRIVQVHKVLFPPFWQCCCINSVAVVLRRDVAPPGSQIELLYRQRKPFGNNESSQKREICVPLGCYGLDFRISA